MINFKNLFGNKQPQYNGSFVIEKINLNGLEIEMRIHGAESNNVLIMYPGADGSIDGYNQKYLKIANMIQSLNIASVVRLDNEYCVTTLPYIELMISKMASIIEYVTDNAETIFGQKNINLHLSGVSAGAGAIATLLEEFPMVEKVLFISPADSVGREIIERGLKNFQGNVYLVAGDEDEIGAFDIAKSWYDCSNLASSRKIEIIPNCDHQFTGKKNGMILSNAFLWAFADSGNFPSSKDGVVLYE